MPVFQHFFDLKPIKSSIIKIYHLLLTNPILIDIFYN